MKKDPLQREPTAYELAGLAPGADAAEIARKVGSDGTTGAQELIDPAQRALVDLFLYQDRYLDDLAFDEPFESLAVTAARRAADERWRAIERRGFPMPAATHSIAVLAYWEARGSGLNGPDLPSPPDVTARLWEAALSRFAALCASEAFWTEWGVVTGNRGLGTAAASALEQRLTDELEAMARLRAGNGDLPGERRVREHLAFFRSELEAARALPALKVLSGRGLSPTAITAGPHLLREVDLLEKVRAAVGAQRPDLLRLFTAFAFIDRLVDEREFETAFGAIERLGPDDRASPEARAIESRIQLELGLEDLEAGRTDGALAHWERAIALAEVRSRVAVPVSEAVLARAKLLHSREEHDDAIGLLQRAMPIGERGLLGVPLAHFLHERADGRIERASIAGDDLAPAIAEMRGAVADLEEAVVLDPTNSEIRDRRNEAEDLLAALLARAGPVPADVTGPAAVAPVEEPAAVAPGPLPPIEKRVAALPAIGVALWIGVSLLVLVVYPLFMAGRLGGLGTIVVAGLAVGWVAANVAGWFLLR